MREAGRLSWLIHGSGYDDKHEIEIYEYEESDITFPKIWQAPMCHELRTGKCSGVDVS